MCGIFGFVDFQGQYDIDHLTKMSKRLVHRGPDSFKVYQSNPLYAGFNRLSIVDLENGNQPFSDSGERFVVFCNGEIYNFEALWALVNAERKTNSDIEVIPHLFEKYGVDMVHKLRGIFVIFIYDSTENIIYIFRDQVGVKPLYFSFEKGLFLYASEMKAFLDFDLDFSINHESFHAYLDLMFIPSPFTPFEKVQKLEPGSLLKFNLDKKELSIERYFDGFDLEKEEPLDETDQEKLGLLIEDAAKLNLLSDVPICSFLSGGVDSSILTVESCKLNKEITALHMDWGTLKNKVNETEVVEFLVDKYNFELKSFVSQEIIPIGKIPELIYALDEPNADAAFIPSFMLSKFASEQGFKVILSGAGGDELFGGYSRYRSISKLKGGLGKLILNKNPNLNYDFLKKGFIRNSQKVLNTKRDHSIEKHINNFHPKIASLNKAMLVDFRYYLCDNILMLTDKMTSWNSMEARVPFLHYELFEYAFSVNGDSKTANGSCYKKPLKEYAESIIPKEFIYRNKEGFGFPIEHWLSNELDFTITPFILSGYLCKNKILNERYLMKLLFPFSKHSRIQLWRIWHIFILEIWCQLFIEKKPYETIL